MSKHILLKISMIFVFLSIYCCQIFQPEEEEKQYGEIEGIALYTNGDPVIGVEVYQGQPSGSIGWGPNIGYSVKQQINTDSTGHFHFKNVEAQEYWTIWLDNVEGCYREPEKYGVKLEPGQMEEITFTLTILWP